MFIYFQVKCKQLDRFSRRIYVTALEGSRVIEVSVSQLRIAATELKIPQLESPITVGI